MSNYIPPSIQDDAFNLDGAAQSILFKLVLADLSVVCLSPKKEYLWQGDLYEEVPCNMSAVDRKADSENSRPRFSVVNPEGMFTSAVHQRLLEGARLTRHRILHSDLLADNNSALSDSYRVSRVLNVTRDLIVVECRGALDGAGFRIPNRTFRPPEFPVVRIK